MTSLLQDIYGHRKHCLMEDLSTVKFCGITIDLWTSVTTENYLTVTCHYVTDWKLHTSLLETSHLAVYIQQKTWHLN